MCNHEWRIAKEWAKYESSVGLKYRVQMVTYKCMKCRALRNEEMYRKIVA